MDWAEEIPASKKTKADVTQDIRQRPAAQQVQSTWWKYRPSVPYDWLFSLLERKQVEQHVYWKGRPSIFPLLAFDFLYFQIKWAVFSEDMRYVYVKVARGFPNEYKVLIFLILHPHKSLI